MFERNIRVSVKRLPHFRGELPEYESENASGFDVRAQLQDTQLSVEPGARVLVPTGLAFEIPPGLELQVRARSGWASKKGMAVLNGPGTIDADYRGEVKVILANLGQETVLIDDQDRIAQLVLCPVFKAVLVETGKLTETARGSGGFGSTGR
ncbi:MAG TPA: dUTP diphosphatase [Bdellovibrionales bacterium]|nr:dUTP diphosphatase [Bdellovibrionales bacterium]